MSRKIVPEKYTLHWLLVMLHFVCLDGKTPQSRRTTRDRMKRKRGEFGAVFAALLLRRTDAMRVSRDPPEKSGKSGRNLKIRKSKRRLCRPRERAELQKSAIAAKVQKKLQRKVAEKICRATKTGLQTHSRHYLALPEADKYMNLQKIRKSSSDRH